LLPEAKPHEVLDIRQQIRASADDLTLGSITPAQYCEQAVARCETTTSPASLERQIVETSPLRRDIAGVVRDIPDTYEKWLVADFPSEWVEEMSERWETPSLFPKDQIVVTSELGLNKMVPEVFYHLPREAGRTMGECIAVDARSARAVAATTHGLAAIICVYEEQLKLQLALQDIWQTEANVLHPTSSEKVDF
jgi:hypothetical protein